jgi:hypothetical protein
MKRPVNQRHFTLAALIILSILLVAVLGVFVAYRMAVIDNKRVDSFLVDPAQFPDVSSITFQGQSMQVTVDDSASIKLLNEGLHAPNQRSDTRGTRYHLYLILADGSQIKLGVDVCDSSSMILDSNREDSPGWRLLRLPSVLPPKLAAAMRQLLSP